MYAEVVALLTRNINFHEINSHVVNSYKINFSRSREIDLLCAPLEVGGYVSGNVEVRIFLAESIETQECVFFK